MCLFFKLHATWFGCRLPYADRRTLVAEERAKEEEEEWGRQKHGG